MTSPQPTLDGHRPVDLLRDGDIDTVVAAARRFAAATTTCPRPRT